MPDPLRERLQASLGAAYTIERELGGGGMSRVFVAEEAALGRRVVVKLLAPELAEGLSAERFMREIRLAATLQQANIVPLLSAGAVDGLPYYTMPFVDGESLRAHLDRAGALPVAEAVSILRDVARALGYAHRRGVVHRDVKPENVLLSGGAAVVTDFGIAKAIERARTSETTSEIALDGAPDEAPRAVALTAVGVALGTPAYMAPEQAAGEPVDARADVYALGCLAYELLAGAPPFAGRAPLQLLAAHVGEAPAPIARRRPELPPALAALVDRCLAKRPDDRPPDAEAVLRALDAAVGSGGAPAAARPAHRARVVAAAALAGALALGAAAFAMLRPRSAPFVAGTLSQVTASPELEGDVALSPDGRLLAYVTLVDGAFRVVVRQLAGGRTVVVSPDSGPGQRWPRWAPDGTTLLYASGGIVYEVPALGGPARPVAGRAEGFVRGNPTAAYSPDGRRIAWSDSAGILVRDRAGGTPRRVAQGFELHSAAWSPDGTRLAYVSGNQSYVTVVGNTSPSSVWTIPVDGGAPARVTDGRHLNVNPVWAPDGRSLLYISNAGGTRDVWQVALRADGAPAGAPSRLTNGLEPYTMSLSTDGTRLAYSVLRQRANVWVVPIGASGATPASAARQVTVENQRVEGLALSPDGRWLAYDANRRGNADVFRIPAEGGEPVQLTTDAADDFQPAWSADGRRLAFYSTRAGTRDVYAMDADGGSVERVTALPGQERFPAWSPDGARIAFASNATGAEEVYVVSRAASGGWSAPVRLTDVGVAYPRWSPDGRWIAAVSARRGVLLVPAAGGPARTLVAPAPDGAGAVFATWGRDPSVLYYLTIDVRRAAWRFWRLPVAGGPPRLVFALEGRRAPGGITFTTDDRRLFFTRTDDEADVWTMELQRAP